MRNCESCIFVNNSVDKDPCYSCEGASNWRTKEVIYPKNDKDGDMDEYYKKLDKAYKERIKEVIEEATRVSVLKSRHEVGHEAKLIQDSGNRTEFDTGAVRDMHEGKGDMLSIPPNAILRLSILYEQGAKKYDRFNYLKGIPCSSFMDSALRHLAKYNAGYDDEDHLASAVFNILGIMEMEAVMPEMQDIPSRQGKKGFNYLKK